MEEVDNMMIATVDPQVKISGKPIPALTTLLYKVCENDRIKFEEATRLIKLFMETAYNAGYHAG